MLTLADLRKSHEALTKSPQLAWTSCKKGKVNQVGPDSRHRRVPLVVNELFCESLGAAIPHQTCGCKEKLRKCEVFGTCTTKVKRPGIACCDGCSEWGSPDPWRRHLCYFIFPLQGEEWKWNVDQLRQRLDLFNGRRVVAVCNIAPSDKFKLASFDEVRERLGDGVEYLQVPQYRANRLGEVTAFPHLLRRVSEFRDPGDVTFYGHAKGVTKPGNMNVQGWTELMYRANLDHWSEVSAALTQHVFAGALKVAGWWRWPWHYHGTFYWFRNADVFARNWSHVEPRYGGTEMWVAGVAQEHEAADLFGTPTAPLYLEHAVAHSRRTYETWKEGTKTVITAPTTKPPEPEPVPTLAGTGVVMVTDRRFEASAYVSLSMLRRVYDGPVQIWHHSNYDPSKLRIGDTTFHTLPGPRFQWTDRTHAMLNSGLRYVLHLDSDVYPVQSLDPVFNAAEDHGECVWRDHTTGDFFLPRIYGLATDTVSTTFTPQCGAMALDMMKHWNIAREVHWYCEHGSYYFQFNPSYDQPQWRAAFARHGVTPYRFSDDRVAVKHGIVFLHNDATGATVFVHRTGAKFGINDHRLDDVPGENDAWEFYNAFTA